MSTATFLIPSHWFSCKNRLLIRTVFARIFLTCTGHDHVPFLHARTHVQQNVHCFMDFEYLSKESLPVSCVGLGTRFAVLVLAYCSDDRNPWSLRPPHFLFNRETSWLHLKTQQTHHNVWQTPWSKWSSDLSAAILYRASAMAPSTPSSNLSSKTSKKDKSSASSSDHHDTSKEKKKEERRRRKIESAKRSRERLRNEPHWVELQLADNRDRIDKLSQTVEQLSEDLHRPAGSTKSQQDSSSTPSKRPSWYGDPFWTVIVFSEKNLT